MLEKFENNFKNSNKISGFFEKISDRIFPNK